MLKLWLCQPGCSLIGVLVLAAISGGYTVDIVVLSPQYCIGQSTNFTAFYDCFLKKTGSIFTLKQIAHLYGVPEDTLTLL